jgi:dolichol-phosphate mannosyltransferase
MPKEPLNIDLVLPVHNEAGTIEHTLREFHATVIAGGAARVRFVVSEDGSRDDSVAILRRLAQELPLHLISEPVRKGYSRAVIDGFRATTAEWVAFIDSDGQCDPRDLGAFCAEARNGSDLTVGYRNPRTDPPVRLWMSAAFGFVFRRLFPVRLRDPSCPYLLIRRSALRRLLEGQVGILKQGFWWEFMARATALGLQIREVPIHHRQRAGNVTTQIYLPSKVPSIAWQHLWGLLELRAELRRLRP